MTTQPNILLIMCDQLMPHLTGAYGHPVVQTPNLDKLVARGVRFDNAYTPCPVCSPARAAFMTGRYVSRIGCYDNATVLASDQPTFAHYLANAGYDVTLAGKMHFIGPDQLHGFHRRLTTDVYPSSFAWTPTRDPDGNFRRGGHVRGYLQENLGVRPWNIYFTHDEEVKFRALEYLYDRVRTKAEGPFFLCASFHHPHDPFQPSQELWDLYEGAPIDIPTYPPDLAAHESEMDRWLNAVHGAGSDGTPALSDPANLYALRRAYYALVTYIDRKVGELLDALERTGLAENTIVLFCSDHGDMLAERKMVQKRCFYEYSARIPLIVAMPDGEGAGRIVDAPVSLLDIAPTLLDWAGVPTAARLAIDGQSLVPLLADPHPDNPKETTPRVVISEFHTDKVKAPCFMVRKGPYKYVYIHGFRGQLFDLTQDPGEWENLVDDPAHAAVVDEMRGLILAEFDPEWIVADAAASIARRELIHAAMQQTDTHWDYSPHFDATKRFVR
jgi:choline-sulfatase